MTDSQFVKVLDATDYLAKVGGGVFFFNAFALYNQVKKFTPRAVFHDEVEIF